MTDKEIIKALKVCTRNKTCRACPYRDDINCVDKIATDAIDLINRQREQLEATIAGQETLQKALAEKDREVSVLNSDLKLLRNDYDYLKEKFDKAIEKNIKQRDKVVRLTAEKDSLIKTFGECQAEVVKDFSKAVMDGLADGKILIMSDMVDFTNDYLKGKEMAGDKE